MDREYGIMLDDMICIGSADGWYYFTNVFQGRLCKAREDGSELQEWVPPLPDYIEAGDTSDFAVTDGWVYFLYEYESSADYAGFYKMRPDGSELEMFHSEILEDVSCSLDVVEGGWAYFTLDYYTGDEEDDDTEVCYKIRIDGSGKEKR